MSNVERFRDNCLMEANGNRDEAFLIACRKAVQYWNNISPGYVRERPYKPTPFVIDTPDEPVLLESERG